MEVYFKKTRRLIQPAAKCFKELEPQTKPKCFKEVELQTTPKKARLSPPLQPPPVPKKRKLTHPHVRPIPLDLKITEGPLKGISSSLLDIIRAKEAASKSRDPEKEREIELLGIAPQIVRCVVTVFTSSKKQYLPYDKILDKCFIGLKSNYTTSTITQCLDLMSKVAPDWSTTVDISKGKFMRLNRTKYTMPELLKAISNYKKNIC